MTENTELEPEPKSPTEAFDDLRREVAFMRKVIERMADDQRAAPDYSETLGTMADSLTTASKSLGWLTQCPIVKTTAEQMAQEISKAGNDARVEDQRIIADAAAILREATSGLWDWVASARKTEDQEREVLWTSAIAAGAAAVLVIILLFGGVRLLPEHSASWILGKNRWEAGQQLMASADPEQWAAIQQAAELDRDNHQPVVDCEKSAKRNGQDEHCRVILKR